MTAALLAFQIVAQPIGDTGTDLFFQCTGKGVAYKLGAEIDLADDFAMFDMMACLEYVNGIIDATVLHRAVTGTSLFCPPAEGMRREQQMRIVVKHISDNPENMHQSKRSLVVAAMSKAFPCRPTAPENSGRAILPSDGADFWCQSKNLGMCYPNRKACQDGFVDGTCAAQSSAACFGAVRVGSNPPGLMCTRSLESCQKWRATLPDKRILMECRTVTHAEYESLVERLPCDTTRDRQAVRDR